MSRPATSVVIADDDIDIRLLVAAIAHQAGWHVETVADGTSALDAAGVDRPDAFVLDVNMPGMSGIDVCRTLKSARRTGSAAVLLMSADTSDDNVAAAHAAGCDRSLPKPFSRRELLDALNEAVDEAGWLS